MDHTKISASLTLYEYYGFGLADPLIHQLAAGLSFPDLHCCESSHICLQVHPIVQVFT